LVDQTEIWYDLCMVHTEILETIKRERQEGDFIYPDYGRYSIAEIPQTILSLFGYSKTSNILPVEYKAGDFEKIIFVFADAFGFDLFLKEYKNYQLLNDLVEKGEVLPLTSVFPSTTSAATSLFHSGLTPQEHGLPEWVLYFKELKQIIQTLPFKPINGTEIDELLKQGGKPEMLFEGETIYEKLNSVGVKSFVFISQNYAKSAYTEIMQRGAETIDFSNTADLISKFKDKFENYRGRAYYMIYNDQIDSAGHHFGLQTAEQKKAISDLFDNIKSNFIEKLEISELKTSLMIVSADHGQIATDPKETIYLNNYPKLVANFTIMPTGNSRDVFLNVKEDKIDETKELLKKILGDKAKIIETSDVIKLGLFGSGTPTQRFLDRVGNILVLPTKNQTIWYQHNPPKKFEYFAMHGGLSEQEMIVPFAYAKIEDLI